MGGGEWAILVLIALLLFGGSRLSGIGRHAGRAVREFKEETAALKAPVGERKRHDEHAASPDDPEMVATTVSPSSPPRATPASAPSPTESTRD